ncbi:hypothetical protein [Fulvivirga ligni]|uniref:hypothetical protein n=1 Tax=Fulvivirga ligni TaxID=2904246 RepID=UPI001F325B14|nr:hypothetical protein [Fulvivirga ligni]UII19094.1 hypothetical protein LVD16_14715 [Fulvivirga ligni]
MNKYLVLIAMVSVFLSCSEKQVTDSYYYQEINIFPESGELLLYSNGDYTTTELDYHTGVGGVEGGNFTWHNDVLILKGPDSSHRYYLKLDGSLYRIVEYDSTNDDLKFVRYSDELPMFNNPVRTFIPSWYNGEIEDFDALVSEFKSNPDNAFTE